MKKLFIAIVLFSFMACKPTASVVKTRSVKDSVSTKVTFTPKDTVITVPGKSISISKPISELSPAPIVKKLNGASISLKKVGDTIEAYCEVDELKLIIQLQERLIEIYKQHATESSEVAEVPVKYIPPFVKFLAWLGAIFFVLAIAAVILRIKKII